MFNRFRYSLLLALTVFIAWNATAQSAMPDYVFIGATKHYNVTLNPSSTYSWWIDRVLQVGVTSNSIDITWTTAAPNPHLIEVQEHPAEGCDGPKRSGEVYVSELPTLPEPFSECVKNLTSVRYNPATKTIDYDQPDYYTLNQGDTRLDLINFRDFGSPSCPMRIGWRIDFSPATDPSPPHNIITLPPLTGTGQPSSFGNPINLPGDGATYNNVGHTITYWIEDCEGKHIVELGTQTITIKPRPKIE